MDGHDAVGSARELEAAARNLTELVDAFNLQEPNAAAADSHAEGSGADPLGSARPRPAPQSESRRPAGASLH